MNTPTPRTYDLHLPGSFGKVVSFDAFKATHRRKDAHRTAPINPRPRNDDPPPRAA